MFRAFRLHLPCLTALGLCGALALGGCANPASAPEGPSSSDASSSVPSEQRWESSASSQTEPVVSDKAAASASASSSAPSSVSSALGSASSDDGTASASSALAGSSDPVTPPELTDAIMGESIIGAESMAKLYHERGVEYPADVYEPAGAPTIEDFCALCVEEADAEGVRAEVLFAQAMHETAWLQFGNQVSVEQCNFGGLGAVNSGGAGETFADVREGLRAQVQHLKAYASTEELANECVDTRFDLVERGCAPTVQDLGGRWAWPGDTYGDAIMTVVADLYEKEYDQPAPEVRSVRAETDEKGADAVQEGDQ